MNQAKSLSKTVILDTETGQPYNRVLKQFMVTTTHKYINPTGQALKSTPHSYYKNLVIPSAMSCNYEFIKCAMADAASLKLQIFILQLMTKILR